MLAKLRKIHLAGSTPEQRKQFRCYRSHHFQVLQHFVYGATFRSNLRALAVCYWTDKWTAHSYVDIYETLFAPLRRKRLKIL
ncbi:MAG: hypothetical protein ACLQVF_19780 [Isosphaeraceae bacterium]